MKKTLITILSLSLISPLAFADSKSRYRAKIFGKIHTITDQIQTNTNNIQSLTDQIQNLPGGGTGTTPPGNDAQVQANTSAITNLNTQVQANTAAISNGTGGTAPPNDPQVQTNTTAISNLNNQVQGNSTAISNNTAQIQANTGNITGVSAETQSNTATNGAQASQIQANSAANAAQDSSIQAIGAANTAQDALIGANTATNTTQNGLIQTNTTNTQNMQTTVDGLTSQVGTIQSDLNVQGTQVQANTDNIVTNATRISALEGAGGGGGTTPPPPVEPAPTAIDFLLYIPAAGTKEFQETTSVNVSCKIIRHDITRVDNATSSDIRITETYTNGFTNCTVINTDYRLTATSFSVVGYTDDLFNANITYDAPGDILNNAMAIGNSFGYANSNAANRSQITIQKSTVMGIESVSVPAGSYTNCLKVHTTLKSNIVTPNLEGISWYCPGVGEVKRVYHDTNANSYITRQLTSIL